MQDIFAASKHGLLRQAETDLFHARQSHRLEYTHLRLAQMPCLDAAFEKCTETETTTNKIYTEDKETKDAII